MGRTVIGGDTGLMSASAEGTTFSGWLYPANMYASDNTDAWGISGEEHDLTGFGFSVAADITIAGVEVLIEGSDVANIGIALTEDAGVDYVGAEKTVVMEAGETTQTAGSSSDLWGHALTPAIVNSSSFGVVMTTDANVDVDHVQIKIYYAGRGELAQARVIESSRTAVTSRTVIT